MKLPLAILVLLSACATDPPPLCPIAPPCLCQKCPTPTIDAPQKRQIDRALEDAQRKLRDVAPRKTP